MHRKRGRWYREIAHLTLIFTADSLPRLLSISYSKVCPSLSVLGRPATQRGLFSSRITYFAGFPPLIELSNRIELGPIGGQLGHRAIEFALGVEKAHEESVIPELLGVLQRAVVVAASQAA
jgi:hypothetical protein